LVRVHTVFDPDLIDGDLEAHIYSELLQNEVILIDGLLSLSGALVDPAKEVTALVGLVWPEQATLLISGWLLISLPKDSHDVFEEALLSYLDEIWMQPDLV
jgi:hypothetical protein